MRGRHFFAVPVALIALFAFVSSAAAQNPFCLPGSGAGQCAEGKGPQGLGVDFETGHVYVADEGNNRVNGFEANGTPLSPASIGAAQLTSPEWVSVDNNAASASRHDLWATSEKGKGAALLVKKFKPSGEFIEADSFGEERETVPPGPTELCRFKPNDPIAVGPEGKVYVADSYDKDGAGPGKAFVNRVLVFPATGGGTCLEELFLFEGESQTIRNFAVDSGGHIYVTVAGGGGVIRKYSPAGSFEYPLDSNTETEGIAVDAADNLYAKQRGRQVSRPAGDFFFSEFSPAGTTLRRFGYLVRGSFLVPALVAYHSAEGDLFASEGSEGVRYLKAPPPGPVTVPEACHIKGKHPGSISATLQAEINPEGKATSFWFEYLTQAKFEEKGGFIEAEKSQEVELGAGASDFELHEAALKVSDLEGETKYRCRVMAKNADGESEPGEEGEFTTEPPFVFGPAWTEAVSTSATRIFVEGNPLGVETKGQIEYVSDAQYQASKWAQAQIAPGEVLFEETEDEELQLQSLELSGLAPGTVYHYRLRVHNAGLPEQGMVCPEQKAECPELEHTFRTYLPEAPEADGRRYELVSPGEKNSAEVAVPGSSSGLVEPRSIRIQAGSGEGNAVTYTSWTSFGAAEGAPSTSQYLSKRTAAGWETENVSPFGFIAQVLFPPYVGFSPDLRFGAFKTREPALTPDCRKSEGIYLRDNETGALRCLDPEAPEGPEAACLVYAGASEDASRVFLAGKPAGGENFTYSLYESSASGTQLVSVLPNGQPAPPTAGTSFGPANTNNGVENCQVTRTILRHAISADGSRAFWTFVPEGTVKLEDTQLFVRVDGSKTEQLDKKRAGGSGEGEGRFWGANAEGSVAYFTDTEKLITGAKAEAGKPDLYRYEIGRSQPLTDLTANGSGPANVQGVVGISDDGSYVYFVATGTLASGAKEGASNLYLFHEGTTRFIATLSKEEDSGDWSAEPREMSARVSPDGKHLAFLSIEAQKLAHYDNQIAVGEHCKYEVLPPEGEVRLGGSPLCAEAFLYDVEGETLSCASCNPAGSRPLGPTVLPGWTNNVEGPRFLSDDGARLFFQTFDALLPRDVNGKLDVYEFERPGTGAESCNAANPNFDPTSGGCHFLVSTGKSEDESFLVDASSDGRDVFFSTRQLLVGWDVNENYDVYDYRSGGGFPEPPPPAPVCEGEASCKPPGNPAPPPPAPATPGFNGPGNPKPKQKNPHHKKQKKHNKKGKGKKKHAKKGRAGR